ncbi:hypothetical protein EON67_02330, partial [archaeon]
MQLDEPGMRDAVNALIVAEMAAFTPPDYCASLPRAGEFSSPAVRVRCPSLNTRAMGHPAARTLCHPSSCAACVRVCARLMGFLQAELER